MKSMLDHGARVALIWMFALLFSVSVAIRDAHSAEVYTPDSIQFRGGDSLRFDPEPRFSVVAGGTIEFWVSPDWKAKLDFDPVIVSSAGAQGVSFAIAILRDRDGLVFATDKDEYPVAFNFADGKLHHVAVSQFDDGIVIMVDGKIVGSSPLKARKLPVSGFWVGSIDGTSNPFLGVVAGLRIWREPISREALVRFALLDVIANDHPDLDALSAISDFSRKELLLVEAADRQR